MGTFDEITYSYFKKAERFADIINYKIFNGEYIIRPEMLYELDSREVTELYNHENNKNHGKRKNLSVLFDPKSKSKNRDIIKAIYRNKVDETLYSIVCIENQNDINNAMPVRNMLYDAIRYDNQVNDIKAKNRDNKNISGSEYISGFRDEDTIVPVVTIVILWSPDKWNGPRSLHKMFSIQDPRILKLVPDYEINLIEPFFMNEEDFEKLNDDISTVLRIAKYSNDDKTIKQLLTDNDRIKPLPPDAKSLIGHIVGRELENEEGDEGNMSNVFQRLLENERTEGREEGREEGVVSGSTEAFDAMDLIKKGFTTLEDLKKNGISEPVAKAALSRIQ